MEMGPQAEQDNDLEQGRRRRRRQELSWTPGLPMCQVQEGHEITAAGPSAKGVKGITGQLGSPYLPSWLLPLSGVQGALEIKCLCVRQN